MKRFTAALVLFCLISAQLSARNCRPDISKEDKISKESIVIWAQPLFATGFLASMVNTSEVAIVLTVGHYGSVNAINIEIQKKEESAENASFESALRGARGSRFYLGFKGGEPAVLTVTDVSNSADVQQGLFAAKGVTTVVLSAAISDAELRALHETLTTKPIDAVRVLLSGDLRIEKSVDERNGQRMMEKFACFYQYLADRGMTPAPVQTTTPASADSTDPLAIELLAVEHAAFKAVVEKDIAALAIAIADDANFKEDGKELGKPEILAKVMAQPEVPGGVQVEPEFAKVSVRMDGEIAELSYLGTIVIRGSGSRKPIAVASHKDRFRKVDGRWVFVGSEVTTISRLSK